MNILNKRVILAAALAISGLLIVPQTASAHKPVISGSATCGDNGWSVDWTVSPSGDHPTLNWQVRRPSGAYSPAGAQPADISSSFTRTTFHSADTTTVTETTWSDWVDPQSGLVIAQSTRSATVTRPEGCTAVGSSGSTVAPPAPLELPATGSNSTALSTWLAVLLVGLGFMLTLVSRRKRVS
jgi:LPXTG-motif cell wall-anchored protein